MRVAQARPANIDTCHEPGKNIGNLQNLARHGLSDCITAFATMTVQIISIDFSSQDPDPKSLLRNLQSVPELKDTKAVLWGTSNSRPLEHRLLIKRPTSIPFSTLSPLEPFMTKSITSFNLPYDIYTDNLVDRPIDILTFSFTKPPTEEFQRDFAHAAEYLTTDIIEASKSGGANDDPCLQTLCSFDDDRCYLWVKWKNLERRQKFMDSKAGRGYLRLVGRRQFQGCDWEAMGTDFWEPLVWLGGTILEKDCFFFENLETTREGWSERWGCRVM